MEAVAVAEARAEDEAGAEDRAEAGVDAALCPGGGRRLRRTRGVDGTNGSGENPWSWEVLESTGSDGDGSEDRRGGV